MHPRQTLIEKTPYCEQVPPFRWDPIGANTCGYVCICVCGCAYVLEKQTTQKCLEPDALDIYFYTALSVSHERKQTRNCN